MAWWQDVNNWWRKHVPQPKPVPVPTPTPTPVPTPPAPVPTPPPPTPATFTAKQVGTNQIQVTWTGFSPTQIGRDGVDSSGTGAWNTGPLTGQPTSGSFTFNGLIPGDTYTITATETGGALATVAVKMSGSTPAPTPVPVPTPVPTPTPPPVVASGIPAIPTSVAGRTITQTTNFAGLKALPSNWSAWAGAPGGTSNAWWDSAHIQFNPNYLSLITSGPGQLPNGNNGYTSGGMGCSHSQVNGRTDVCIRFPSKAAGMSFIALTWPNSGTWPVDGEGDFVETGGDDPITGFNATEHYGAQNSNPQVHTPSLANFDWTAFHVWGYDASPGLRIYYVDGVEWGRLANSNFPNKPMNLDFQAQYLGWGTPTTPCPYDIAWCQQYA